MITVHKLNLDGEETWRYTGKLLLRWQTGLLIEAFFDREDLPFHGLTFKRGDRFLEAYFTRRWYNVFEIYDRDEGALKGWYCNVSTPASLAGDDVRFVDLALDLLVFPDGRQLVLDEDEFERTNLDGKMRRVALAALDELKGLVQPAEGFRLERYLSGGAE